MTPSSTKTKITEASPVLTTHSQLNRILHLVETNTDIINRKLASLVPNSAADAPINHVVPINNQVGKLLDASVDPVNLSRVSPYYIPWF